MTNMYSVLGRAKKIPGVFAFIIECTVEIAIELLKCNLHNRKIKCGVVEKYIDEINNGEWVLSAQGIGIDSNGILCDGQHRLEAIIKSGKAIPLIVVTGLAPLSQEKVDRQSRRSLYDVFKLAGYSENSTEVKIATFMAAINNGFGYHNSDSEIKNTLECHKDAISVISKTKTHERGICRVGFLTACVFYYELYPEKALVFIKKVQDGVMLTNDDPAMRIRKYLLGELSSKIRAHGGQSRVIDYKKTIYAINADISNKKITALKESDVINTSNQ